MIGYIKGEIMYKQEDRLLLIVNHIGYEVLVPSVVMARLSTKSAGDVVSLYIYHQQTERQPKPVLIGFNSMEEKDFFQEFISVDAIGVIKAVKALIIPIDQIANAIENGDIKTLKGLNGVGVRTAHKILASLRGKMDKFISGNHVKVDNGDIVRMVQDVLVVQLGYKVPDAKKMIKDILEKDKSISTAEELFNKIYSSGIR